MRQARSIVGARIAPWALTVGAALALGGCHTVTHWAQGRDIRPAKTASAPAQDCSQGGPGCHPTDRRQYYDSRSARYYYFDAATGRYYWENGEPRF